MKRHPNLSVALALFGLGLGAQITWRVGLGLWGAYGTDAVLWGLCAMNLRVGAPSVVPPGYPGLVALVSATGVPLVPAGWGVAMVAAAAVPAAVWLAARAAGAGAALAGAAAVVSVALPDLLGWGQQVQPDSLTALLVTALGGLLAAAAAGGERSRAAGWAAAALAGTLPLVREHGLALLPAAGVALVALPGPRLGRLAVVLAAWWASPLLVGTLPGATPWDTPWADRPGDALGILLHPSEDTAGYARALRPDDRRLYVDLLQSKDRLGLVAFHARRSWQVAWDVWLGLAGGALAALVTRRRAALALVVPLAAALPALLIFSQRRHVLVAVPLALAALAAAMAAVTGLRRLAAVLGVALAAVGVARWPAVGQLLAHGQQTEVFRARSLAETARWIDENLPPNTLLGGYLQDVGLYSPRPRHDASGMPADWLTAVVGGDSPPGAGWERVHKGDGELSVWRLAPARAPRPCGDATAAPGTPYLVVGRATAVLNVGAEACGPPQGSPGTPATR